MKYVFRTLFVICVIITVGCFIAQSWYQGALHHHLVDTGWCALFAAWFFGWVVAEE